MDGFFNLSRGDETPLFAASRRQRTARHRTGLFPERWAGDRAVLPGDLGPALINKTCLPRTAYSWEAARRGSRGTGWRAGLHFGLRTVLPVGSALRLHSPPRCLACNRAGVRPGL